MHRFPLRRRWSDLVFILLSIGLLLWVGRDAFSTRIVTISQGADYWEHSATLRALLDNPWHPKNPHLVSPASSPRFVPLFILAALLGRVFGLDALGAMGVVSVLNIALLLLGIFFFFRVYFRDPRASLYGLLVMFTSWYDGWHFSNVYQLKIFFSVVAYPSITALGLSLLGFTCVLRALRQRATAGRLLGIAAIFAALAITHPLTAVLGFWGALLLALTEPGVALLQRGRVALSIVIGGALALLWPYFSLKGVLTGGSYEEISAIARELAGSEEVETSSRLHPFYRINGLLRTLGLALLGLPLSIYLIVRRRHWFISLGTASMLVPFIINAYVSLPLGHRFILLAIFFLQVAVVWWLLTLTPGSPQALRRVTSSRLGWASAGVVGTVLLLALWWNTVAALDHVAYAERKLAGISSINVRYARRAAEVAGKDAVILADPRNSWPVPTFGPKVVTLLHGNPLVLDEPERQAETREFFRGSTPNAARAEILAKYGVTHVLGRRSALRGLERFLSQYGRRQQLPGGYVLYSVQSRAESRASTAAPI